MSQAETSPQHELLALRQELWIRTCRRSFVAFVTQALLLRNEVPGRHHHRICAELEALSRWEITRLMILAPPGSARTTYVSRCFPAWFLGQDPHLSVILVSHTSEMAEMNSVHVQRIVQENEDVLGYGLASNARSDWETTNGGRICAIGVGDTIMGMRADLAILDDPIRGGADAESLIARTHLWDWFRADLLTRLKPNGAIVLTTTPYHEDDLMGRILRQQASTYRVLCLPAIAEADDP